MVKRENVMRSHYKTKMSWESDSKNNKTYEDLGVTRQRNKIPDLFRAHFEKKNPDERVNSEK